jgi:hypothetical protein
LVLMGPGDSIHVLAQHGLRHLVFNSAGNFLREVAMPMRAVDAVVRDDGSMILSAPIEVAGSLKALHTITPGGSVQHSFADFVAVPRMPQAATMVLGRSAGGQTWAVPFGKYELQLISRAGAVVQRIVRAPSWFRRMDAPPVTAAAPVVPSQVIGIFHLSPRYLWVVLAASDPTWRPAVGGAAPEQDKVFDTMIEVLDLQERRVVVTRRIDEFYQVGREGFLYRVVVSDGGSATIEVVMPELRGIGRESRQ